MTAWVLAALLFAAPGDGWSNLKHVTRDRLYAVFLRDGKCPIGTISSVGKQGLVLGTDSGLGVAIKRSQIIRVSDDASAPAHTAVFSARSSWSDVKAAAPTGTEYLHIVAKRGEEWKGKQPTVSDDAIAFEGITIAKTVIRYVFYVRSKPLTVDEEYLHEEDLKWLASIPWLGDRVLTKISVLLYNADLAEDNSALACR